MSNARKSNHIHMFTALVTGSRRTAMLLGRKDEPIRRAAMETQP